MGLLELKENHREIVRLEIEGKSREEIAKAVGMNADVVGRLLLHDELVDEYREKLIKEKERILKRAKVRGELKIQGRVEELLEQLYKIAMYGDTDSIKLQACVKGLQIVGIKFDGVEEKMLKAPRIIIRDREEKIERTVVANKSVEKVGDE